MKNILFEKLNRNHKVFSLLIAEAAAVIGIVCMFVLAAGSAAKAADVPLLDLPTAGAGAVIENYVGATGESSTELLSTTALGAQLTEVNEYYDATGNIVGKRIIYNGSGDLLIYDKIPGNERVEKGDSLAVLQGKMEPGTAATVIKESGLWYQIVADGLTGYVKKEGFLTGKDAEANAGLMNKNVAVTTADETWIMDGPGLDTTVICALPANVVLNLLEAGDEFSRVEIPGLGEGWISNGEATLTTIRKTAVTPEEDAAFRGRIAEGIEWGAQIETRLQEEAQGRARSYALAQIAPAAPDSDDVAALRQAIANYAQQFVGILPYVWGESDLTYGVDCSGFTSAIYREYGYSIPRSSDAQAYGGMSVSLDDLRPGDIIAYPGHVAMYISGTTVVHAAGDGTMVDYGDLYMMPIINAVRYIN
ncbi:MAG: C40 family peptidase [Lachnospiraceae bacterium]|nr:C40 family peptidase [Lachnospiraceae bacterium]